MVIIKLGQMDVGVSSKRTETCSSLVYSCQCCHLPVGSATAGVPEWDPSPMSVHCMSLARPVYTLSQCVWTSGGSLWKMHWLSGASSKLNVDGWVCPAPPPPCHDATCLSCVSAHVLLHREQGRVKNKTEITSRGSRISPNHYASLICKFKRGWYRFSVEMLLCDCGTAWSGMLIYFLILPGLEMIIAGSAHRLARKHEKLQTVVLAVAPRGQEVNRNEKNETQIVGWV